MKLNKLIALGVVAATLATPVSALAATTKTTNNSGSVVQTQQEQDKLVKYSNFNANTKQFELLPTAKIYLSKAELKYLKQTMAETNNKIAALYSDKSVTVTVQGNVLKVSPKVSRSINYDSYWDYDVNILGIARVFLSRSFVNNMVSTAGNTTVWFAGGGTALAMEQLLVRVGMASGPAGWIGLACGGGAIYIYDQLVYNCNDTGVVFCYVKPTGAVSIYGA
jgi:hypothetical protein